MKLTFVLLFCFFRCLTIGQQRYDVIISEIMFDPSPAVGLPAYEWIELRNRSGVEVNLQGWRIKDIAGRSGPMPAFILKPDSAIIVCGTTAAASLAAYGSVLNVSSFPSLDNLSDIITLTDNTGATIHALEYFSHWHTNSLKQEGGWSLEMIDVHNPCTAVGNWTSSIGPAGGTPGSVNSVAARNPDSEVPRLLRAYADDPTKLSLVFNETLDSLRATELPAYAGSAGLHFLSASPVPPLFRVVDLLLADPLEHPLIYTVHINGLADCAGNTTGLQEVSAGFPLPASPGAIVVNELLFHPHPSGYDYVELYNRSDSIADLRQLFIANRKSTGELNPPLALGAEGRLLFPGDYLAFTTDPNKLMLHYFVPDPESIVQLNSLPSFPNTGGSVVLTNQQGEIIDEVNYKDDWHFPLLSNPAGVALERINPNHPSDIASNWSSAAASAGYGTPGYRNSQTYLPGFTGNGIWVEPKLFSPDNDGVDDRCMIHFGLAEPGYLARVDIFNRQGHLVRRLINNQSLGLSGYWVWDGLDDYQLPLPAGPYIVLTELFNLRGQTRKFKNITVLGRRGS